MNDPQAYREMAHNARGRIFSFCQLEDAMGAYNRLYRELGGLPTTKPTEFGGAPSPSAEVIPDVRVSSRRGAHRISRRRASDLRDHSHENVRNVTHDCRYRIVAIQ